jgi:ABC-type transport system substrate-binding protein
MLKTREADVAYTLYGALGEEVRRDPTLKLEPVGSPATQWAVFTRQQYEPQSPWSDRRVRLAANHAINRQAINEAETLGHSIPTGNIIPRQFDGALPLEPYPYDPAKARRLLAEAGYAGGFEAGHLTVDNVFTGLGAAIVNNLAAWAFGPPFDPWSVRRIRRPIARRRTSTSRCRPVAPLAAPPRASRPS